MRACGSLRLAVLATAAAFTLAGCGYDSATGGVASGPFSVLILGLPDTLAAGDLAAVRVRVQDAGGNDVTSPAPTLTSSDPGVALVDGAGRVRAIAAGVATIRASVPGASATAEVVVAAGPAQYTLRRFQGSSVPLFIEGDSVAFGDGTVEYRELYLDSGSLTLSGGTQPAYGTALHIDAYTVTIDGAGQRHLALREAHHLRDQGTIRFDERGDLSLTSELSPSLMESASADTGGVTLLYRFSASDDSPSVAVFGRRPR